MSASRLTGNPMPLLQLKNLQLAFGARQILDHADLIIEPGERLCLVGRNGAGKSSLLKVISGTVTADDGECMVSDTTQIAELPQEVPQSLQGSVYDVVSQGLGSLGDTIRRWHQAAIDAADDPKALKLMEQLQQELEAADGWNMEQRIETTISLLQLPAEKPFDALSGGLKRRCLLAQALVKQPDLLLLDEPTNHLDMDSILWLENFLDNYQGALMFITHDRAFLDRLATRIIDLDRGKLSSWPGNYEQYRKAKQQQLDAEESANALFDKKLAQEEVWIRQGIKARRTRNEGRVRALEQMRRERSERQTRQGSAKIETQQADASGKIVIEAEQVAFGWQQKPVVSNFSCRILRGDKIGIIGPNGCGKTTLIQLLLQQLQPNQGSIKTGTKLETAWFDQHRSALDEQRSVRENIDRGSDMITINGSSRHVVGYLKDFLFTPAQMNTPVSALSGGERNRLMLAKLFTRAFNFLIMDEPTNDLDMDTLELLEELLQEYQGTLLLVSHDRSFINHIVDYCFVFEGEGRVNQYIGGYDDWVRQHQTQQPPAKQPDQAARKNPAASKPQRQKLGFNEQRELKSLPKQIEKLEDKLTSLQQTMSGPEYFQQSAETLKADQQQLQDWQQQLDTLYQRWESLEALNS